MVENKKVMAKNIRRFMLEKDVTAREVCDALGFKKTTFNDWINGRVYPRIDKIEMMSNYFGVPKSALVEEPVNFYTPDYMFETRKPHTPDLLISYGCRTNQSAYSVDSDNLAEQLTPLNRFDISFEQNNKDALKLYDAYQNAPESIQIAVRKLLEMEE